MIEIIQLRTSTEPKFIVSKSSILIDLNLICICLMNNMLKKTYFADGNVRYYLYFELFKKIF